MYCLGMLFNFTLQPILMSWSLDRRSEAMGGSSGFVKSSADSHWPTCAAHTDMTGSNAKRFNCSYGKTCCECLKDRHHPKLLCAISIAFEAQETSLRDLPYWGAAAHIDVTRAIRLSCCCVQYWRPLDL